MQPKDDPGTSREMDRDTEPLSATSADRSSSLLNTSAPGKRQVEISPSPVVQRHDVQSIQSPRPALAPAQTDPYVAAKGTGSKMEESKGHLHNEAEPVPKQSSTSSLPSRGEGQQVYSKLDKLGARDLLEESSLRPGVFERLIEIEDIAKQDSRGRRLEIVSRSKRGSDPDTTVIESSDDPYADEWDDVWGTLPRLAYEACIRIAEIIQEDDIEMLATTQRSWTDFCDRTTAQDQPIDAIRIAVGWFADTFRAVGIEQRMCIDRSVDMSGILPLVANALYWLEGLAFHFRRQRLFSDTGVDLHGLGLRLAIPTRTTQEGTIEYQLELHVFMWGGLVDGQADTIEQWAERLSQQGQPSLQNVINDLETSFRDLDEPRHFFDLCRRRRVVFRPGFSAQSVNQSFAADSVTSVDKTVAVREPFSRAPVVVEFPPDPWRSLGDVNFDDCFRKIFGCVRPQEAGIFNSRQYQWDKATLNAENNQLGRVHLLAILRCLGQAQGPQSTNFADTIEFIDFGCFVPLIASHQSAEFFPLFRTLVLGGICVPFLGKQSPSTSGQTTTLLLDESHGLRSLLMPLDKADSGQDGLTVFVTTASKAETERFGREVLDHLQAEARLLYTQQVSEDAPRHVRDAARRSATVEMKRRIGQLESHICVVDQSKSDDTNRLHGGIESEFLKIADPTEWPAEFQDM